MLYMVIATTRQSYFLSLHIDANADNCLRDIHQSTTLSMEGGNEKGDVGVPQRKADSYNLSERNRAHRSNSRRRNTRSYSVKRIGSENYVMT
jgi:hypothetical protein